LFVTQKEFDKEKGESQIEGWGPGRKVTVS